MCNLLVTYDQLHPTAQNSTPSLPSFRSPSQSRDSRLGSKRPKIRASCSAMARKTSNEGAKLPESRLEPGGAGGATRGALARRGESLRESDSALALQFHRKTRKLEAKLDKQCACVCSFLGGEIVRDDMCIDEGSYEDVKYVVRKYIVWSLLFLMLHYWSLPLLQVFLNADRLHCRSCALLLTIFQPLFCRTSSDRTAWRRHADSSRQRSAINMSLST